METAINGKIRLKLFWGCEYSGNGLIPIKRIFKVGRLILSKVIYPTCPPFDSGYYKADILRLLGELYDVRYEKTNFSEDWWYVVRSRVDGGYVGTPEDAYRLLQRDMYRVQKAKTADKVCSIGFNPYEQKWYGWSHRAMYGFGIGDVVKEGDCCASGGWTEDYLKEHPEERLYLDVGFKAKTLGDAKKMAIAFAEAVS